MSTYLSKERNPKLYAKQHTDKITKTTLRPIFSAATIDIGSQIIEALIFLEVFLYLKV